MWPTVITVVLTLDLWMKVLVVGGALNHTFVHVRYLKNKWYPVLCIERIIHFWWWLLKQSLFIRPTFSMKREYLSSMNAQEGEVHVQCTIQDSEIKNTVANISNCMWKVIMFFILNLLLFNSIQKDALRPTNIYVLLWKTGNGFQVCNQISREFQKKKN